MRRAAILKRLVLPGAMAVLLLLALAYWWQSNSMHEIFGTAVFALMIWHIAVNRTWFSRLLRGPYDARRLLSVALHLGLIVSMVILLFTSVAISHTVLAVLPLPDTYALRQIHLFTAYWVMVAVGAHLGLHWSRVMASSRAALRLSPSNIPRTWALRAGAALMVVSGLNSIAALDLWNKLTFTASIEFWDFSTSVSPFFWHWAAVVSLPAIAAHYSLALLRSVELRRVDFGD